MSHKNALPYGEAAMNGFYATYKRNAKKRNLYFDLTKEQFRTLTAQACTYCGEVPNRERLYSRYFYGGFVGNGIDRVDSLKGYTIENCVSCCFTCNRMKGKLPKQVFLTQVRKIKCNLGL